MFILHVVISCMILWNFGFCVCVFGRPGNIHREDIYTEAMSVYAKCWVSFGGLAPMTWSVWLPLKACYTHGYTYACMDIRMHVWIYIRMYGLYVCMHACMYKQWDYMFRKGRFWQIYKSINIRAWHTRGICAVTIMCISSMYVGLSCICAYMHTYIHTCCHQTYISSLETHNNRHVHSIFSMYTHKSLYKYIYI